MGSGKTLKRKTGLKSLHQVGVSACVSFKRNSSVMFLLFEKGKLAEQQSASKFPQVQMVTEFIVPVINIRFALEVSLLVNL